MGTPLLREIAGKIMGDFQAEAYDAEYALIRAAECIEAMGREAAEDHYAVLTGAERFRIKNPSRVIWVNENWRDFVPEAYRDLIRG